MTNDSSEDRDWTRVLSTAMVASFAAHLLLPEVRVFGVSVPLMVAGAASVTGFVHIRYVIMPRDCARRDARDRRREAETS